MGSTRRSFTDEYRSNAVSLLIDHGRAIAEVARSIDVHEVTLGDWVKKARDEGNSAEPVIEPGPVALLGGGVVQVRQGLREHRQVRVDASRTGTSVRVAVLRS
jgi:transposase-like protein